MLLEPRFCVRNSGPWNSGSGSGFEFRRWNCGVATRNSGYFLELVFQLLEFGFRVGILVLAPELPKLELLDPIFWGARRKKGWEKEW